MEPNRGSQVLSGGDETYGGKSEMVRPESTFTAATGSFTETSDAGVDAASMDPGGFGEVHPADHDVLTRPDSLARRAAQPTRDLSPNTAVRQSTRPADSASDSA